MHRCKFLRWLCDGILLQQSYTTCIKKPDQHVRKNVVHLLILNIGGGPVSQCKSPGKNKEIENIVESPIVISPEAVLLGFWGPHKHTESQSQTKSVLFSLAKTTVAARWSDHKT